MKYLYVLANMFIVAYAMEIPVNAISDFSLWFKEMTAGALAVFNAGISYHDKFGFEMATLDWAMRKVNGE